MKIFFQVLSRLPALKLRTKLVLLVMCVAVVSVVPLSIVNFKSAREWGYEVALKNLDVAAVRYAESIQSAFKGMERDAAFMSGFPPISGIQRTMESTDGIDPADGSDLEMWRHRLETIFARLIIERPHYTQLRYIGQKDNWREIVRVNRGPNEPEIVAREDLQQKGDEPYLLGVARSNADQRYFSEVTINRENGEEVGRPTIRIIHPVFDDSGELFGAIVINADYERLLHLTAPDVEENLSATAMTSALDYMVFDSANDHPKLVFHSDSNWRPLYSLNFLSKDEGQNHIIMVDETALYVHQVEASTAQRPFALYVITQIQRADLFAEADSRLVEGLAQSVISVCLSLILALLAETHLTRPLRQFHHKIMSCQDPTLPIELPISSKDEVGELAAAFLTMSNDLVRETLRVRAMFSAVGNAIIVIDEEGFIEEVNPAASAMFGYSQGEIVGCNVGCLMPKDVAQGHQAHVARFGNANRHMGRDREIIGVQKDGTLINLEISVNSVSYSGKRHIIGLARDITDRKAAEARVQELIKEIERSNDELDRFAYVASHDLKAPLRVIENASRWLAEDLEEHLTDDTRESMDLLLNRVARMERLLDDLLEHSRIGRIETETDTIRGDWLMDGIAELLALPELFELCVAPAFADIEVPRMPLETVLLNLVNNAIKHHDREEGRIDVEVIDHRSEYEFRVQDDGPGIPPKYHEKVFELFQTLKPRDHVESSGMGLAMVRKHVDVAGGRICLISDGKRGTTFQLFWPKAVHQVKSERKSAS